MTPEKISIFRQLMVVNSLRGMQGSGIAVFPAQKGIKPHVFRSTSYPSGTLAYDSEVTDYLKVKSHNPACLIGHARLPTSGGDGIEDCHPIMGSHVIGVHNGTLDVVNGQVITKTDHDSRKLFTALDHSRSIEKVLASTSGPMALVWANKQTGQLLFYRNTGRPLHLARVEGDNNTVFWSSEAGALRYVLRRNVPVANEIKVFAIEPLSIVAFPLKPAPGEVKVQTVTKVSFPPPAIKSTGDFYPTRRNFLVKEDELIHILQSGCSNCEQPASFDQYKADRLVFLKETEFVCDTCLSYDITARRLVESENVTIPSDIPYQGKDLPTTH